MKSLDAFEIPGQLSIVPGKGGLTTLQIDTPSSVAEIYLHGAHVTHYQKRGEDPILFLSAASEFRPGKPIRGGVPVIFPWFGARKNDIFHGFARITDWELTETTLLENGAVQVRLRLPGMAAATADLIVTVADQLTIELAVTCTDGRNFTFENCLHTYFHVGDIHQTEVLGLQGASYWDQLLASQVTDSDLCIRFTEETDRIYQNTEAAIQIIDPSLGRAIHVRKSGSKSTVVWNPWVEKSHRMPDFGDKEYPSMLCVESGNVREYAVNLSHGETSRLIVQIDAVPLAGLLP